MTIFTPIQDEYFLLKVTRRNTTARVDCPSAISRPLCPPHTFSLEKYPKCSQTHVEVDKLDSSYFSEDFDTQITKNIFRIGSQIVEMFLVPLRRGVRIAS